MGLHALIALLFAAPGGTACAGGPLLHPQDGPDVDVRILVEDERVVFQIVMNLAFADEIVESAREDEMSLHPVEHDALRHALVAYYKEHNEVEIDGVSVTPVDEGFEVPEPDLSLLPLFPRTGMKALTKMRLVLAYPAKSPPRRVKMVWGPFPPDVAAGGEDPDPLVVMAQLFAEGTDRVITFREEEPGYTWHRSATPASERFVPVPEPVAAATLDLPLLSLALAALLLGCGAVLLGSMAARRRVPARARLVLLLALAGGAVVALPVGRVRVPDPFAGSALPSDDEARLIFAPLHENIYRAFDYTREEDVYDALARSVQGDLLDDLYNEVYQSLVMQEEGGAVSRVQAVRRIETDVEEIGLMPPAGRPGFRVLARWQVDGSVYHWGHSHSRTNEYAARYTVVHSGEGWRIAGSRVLEQQRIEGAPGPAGGLPR